MKNDRFKTGDDSSRGYCAETMLYSRIIRYYLAKAKRFEISLLLFCVKTLFYIPCYPECFPHCPICTREIIIISPAWNRHLHAWSVYTHTQMDATKVYIILMWFVSSGLTVAFNAKHGLDTFYDVDELFSGINVHHSVSLSPSHWPYTVLVYLHKNPFGEYSPGLPIAFVCKLL